MGSIVPIRGTAESDDERAEKHRSVVPAEMPDVACAFCDSTETEPLSIYGCHMMTAQYLCRSCRSVFDWVRAEALTPLPGSSDD